MNGPDLPPLSAAGRLDRVRSAMADVGVSTLVVTDLVNVRWCTGFTGSFGALVVGSAGAVLLTDSRYAEQAPAEIEAAGSGAEVTITTTPSVTGAGLIGDDGPVGLEADHVSWAEQRRWAADLGAEPVPTEGLIRALRSVKDPAELARMQTAAAIVDEVLAEVRPRIRAGITERELALALDDGMRARGAEGPAYDTIVASGPNSALPHARPGDRVLADGDLVVIDAGATVEGYRSDMTRTFVVGEAPERAAAILAIVTEAQAAGVAAVGPGVVLGDVDAACRDHIAAAGYGDAFGHGTGHGVGLDIHEVPAVRAGNTAILLPGQVITVEPGIYVPGFGGVRVEDMVVVTDDGCRPLTRHPKEAPCPPSPPTT